MSAPECVESNLMNDRAMLTKKITRLAVIAHRKRHLPRLPEPDNLRTDAAGSPSESFNRPLLNQIRQARSELFDLGPAPRYEIEALDRWSMRGLEKRVREALYPRKEERL